jgi:hypothetical protein
MMFFCLLFLSTKNIAIGRALFLLLAIVAAYGTDHNAFLGVLAHTTAPNDP